MRAVILGNIMETDDGISNRTGARMYIEVNYKIQGCVLDLEPAGSGGWHSPLNNNRSVHAAERLPWVHKDMFVLYEDYFSEKPTQAEIDNFTMVHGFTPSLVEL